MASRSSGSGSTIAWMVIMGVLGLGGLVFGLVMFNQRRAVERELTSVRTEMGEYVTDPERRLDAVTQAREAAGQSRQSLVGYLTQSTQDTLRRVSGTPQEGVGGLERRLESTQWFDPRDPQGASRSLLEVVDAGGRNLLDLLGERQQQLVEMQRRLEAAEAAAERAQQDRENEVRRIASLQQGLESTVSELTSEVNQYKDEIETYREGLNEARAEMSAAVERAEAEVRDREVALNSRISELERDVVLRNDTIRRLQLELRGKRVEAGDEATLVDATIIGLEPTSNQVFLNIGRRDKVVLGMTFEVYSDASGLRPDASTGDYPMGKATIEVTRVDETSSTARIVRERRGLPVVRGDVVANAVFDPNKTYTFLVYGNFDPQGTGQATPGGRAEVEALISGWGGRVKADTQGRPELTGDVDFVVLGEPPVVPPQPGNQAPAAIISQYVAQQRVAQNYDRLLEQARATSVPILSENRLYTLTGQRGSR